MTLWLVRHGRTLADPQRPEREWSLDPAGYDDVWALRGRLPVRAAWFSAPEPAATETAQLLTDGAVGVLDGLLDRPLATVEPVLATHADQDVVLVGQASVWTALVAALTRRPPDPEEWSRLAVPDLISLEVT